MRIKKICFIGYGSHVEKTLIPSVNLNNKNIKIITKKKLNNFQTFSSVQIALKNLTKDYVFFNCKTHLSHSLQDFRISN